MPGWISGKLVNLTTCLGYTAIYRIVKDVIEGPSHNLLESVAQQIASTTLTKFTRISAIRVKIGKPRVAVSGSLDYLVLNFSDTEALVHPAKFQES